MMTPLTVASSETSGSSFPSLGSPTLTSKDSNLRNESQRQEYDFEMEDGVFQTLELQPLQMLSHFRLPSVPRAADGAGHQIEAPSTRAANHF